LSDQPTQAIAVGVSAPVHQFMSDQSGGSSVMSSFPASSHIFSITPGTALDEQPTLIAEQPQESQPSGHLEPAFGCVDWYLYPQEMLQADRG
jgi:hypothetical protein